MIFWVYILASRAGGTLYVGVTNDLVGAIYLPLTSQDEKFYFTFH
jgi:predicted GIY-YIG superfamily endonuclease